MDLGTFIYARVPKFGLYYVDILLYVYKLQTCTTSWVHKKIALKDRFTLSDLKHNPQLNLEK